MIDKEENEFSSERENALKFFEIVQKTFVTKLKTNESIEIISLKSNFPERWHNFLLSFFNFYTIPSLEYNCEILYAEDRLSPNFLLMDPYPRDYEPNIQISNKEFQLHYSCFLKCEIPLRISVLNSALEIWGK